MNKNEALARDIYKWCKKKELWGDNIAFFNGKAWSSSSKWHDEYGKKIDEDLYEYENKNPKDYCVYSNPDTVTLLFEGPLNHMLNGYVYGWVELESEFSKLFEKYGYYYEMGYSFSLSAYEL